MTRVRVTLPNGLEESVTFISGHMTTYVGHLSTAMRLPFGGGESNEGRSRTMTCRMATQLLSEALDRPLTPGERHEIEEHLAICPPCASCRKQFLELRRGIRRMLSRE